MWPAIGDGEEVIAEPWSDAPQVGDCVVAALEGYPEIARIASVNPQSESFELAADADPEPLGSVQRDALLARVDLLRRRSTPLLAKWRRRRLDLLEALKERPDGSDDQARTVHDKYDFQAQFYATAPMRTDPALVERVIGEGRPPLSILVVGSGVGTEANDLARSGHAVVGIDFSQAMTEHALASARKQALETRFECADLRSFDPGAERFDRILMTYDVYSFIPGRAERIAALRTMREWMRPEGRLFVSARIAGDAWAALLLRLTHRSRRRDGVELGDSHTRWIDPGGKVRRAYVHLFSVDALRGEFAAAGLGVVAGCDGHFTLVAGES